MVELTADDQPEFDFTGPLITSVSQTVLDG